MDNTLPRSWTNCAPNQCDRLLTHDYIHREGDKGMSIDQEGIKQLIQEMAESNVLVFHCVTPEFELYLSKLDDDAPPRVRHSSSEGVASATRDSSAGAPPVSDTDQALRRVDAPSNQSDAAVTQVTAPMLGVLYTAPEPGAEPFVQLGAHVEATDTVGLIEAMKVFTAVSAGVAGTVTSILVANGEYVEFEQPLLEILPDTGHGQ